MAGFRLGASITAETGPYNSATANADAGDDGVIIGTLRRSNTATATVTVSGTGGHLQAWFDWNRDGEVEDSASTVLGVPILSTTKMSVVYATTSFTAYFLPANDVIYTITTNNTGSAATDTGTIFALDSLPAQVEVYVGDFDGAGPATGTVLFAVQNGATLTYAAATDLKYSNLVAAPASFAACTYVPTLNNTYDPAIRHICVNPKGVLASGSPAPGFNLQFRARIK